VSENEIYLYEKDKKRQISPVDDCLKNSEAKKRLDYIFKKYYNNIPEVYKHDWDKVRLYSPSGNAEKGKAIFIDKNDGAYDITNKLNDLTGKQWTKFTCSWFIFNALRKDIKEEKKIAPDSEDHPATFSPTMISDFIRFFTKSGESVIDPFLGIGSTLVACKRTGRTGYGIELNKKYFDIVAKRVPEFKNNIFNMDCRNIDKLDISNIDFSISSPPYWNVLNRSTDGFRKERSDKGLDVKYSDSDLDLGNIEDYNLFLKEVCSVYEKLYPKMKTGAYVTIIVKNIKKGGKMYPRHGTWQGSSASYMY